MLLHTLLNLTLPNFITQLLALALCSLTTQQEPLGEFWGTAEEEAKYYQLVDVPLPEELAIEAGSFEVMPDGKQLAIATRRGDIFLVDGAFDKYPEPTFKKFASGLDEIFGMAYRDGSFHVTQQTEVTRITDEDGDGRADRFDTLSDRWGFRDYHEFAFGSKPDSEGNIWVALCLSKSYHSEAPFRGWALKITPDGQTIPICSGIRSPCGIGPNEHGVMFYAESQGPWNGSCSLKVLEPGGFMGHPISFNWYELAPELGPPPVEPNTPSRLEIERKRVKELVPYAVVFPYKRMGRSISGFMVDRTGGKFGPFENQIFIGDFSLGVVMRATTEKVNGVWQGACYPFREGFDTGLLAVQFTPSGSLIAGGTNRGWPVRGPKAYAVQRLDWTGVVPFEIKEITATPTGFNLEFTKPLNRELAENPATYQLKTFTHIYRQGYGSPEVDQTEPRATQATLSPDGLRVEIVVDGLVQGHVHDFYLPALRSQEDEKLLHASAYYTLNEIPKHDPSPADDTQDEAAVESEATKVGMANSDGQTVSSPPIEFTKPPTAIELINEQASMFVAESNRPSQWTFADGVLTASPTWDSVVTPDAYQDFRMHLEFNINDASHTQRERNGNSGIYIQQRYELQILDSFGVPPEDYKTVDCGGLYGYKKPDQLVCKPPGQWQSFDIEFQAARYTEGQKTANARITVYQNGVLIHDDVELKRKTGAGKPEENSARPVMLQGHHNQVKFRNVWIDDLNTTTKSVATEALADDKIADAIPRITVSQKALPLAGETFKFNGDDAFVIAPRGWQNAQERPWVWYAPTLEGLPAAAEKWMFQKFLTAGIAIAGIDVGESYGSPNGRAKFDSFYQYLTSARRFDSKPCLLARSRGGLMLYNWAAEHPTAVAGIAGIYPVCNLASYPGIEKACGAYNLTAAQLTEQLTSHNPIDRLAGLAAAQVPIFHLHGDVDQVVPLEDNSAIVAERYRSLGGNLELEIPAGQGHSMWSGWFESEQLVEFVLTCLDRLDQHPVPPSNLWLTFTGAEGEKPGTGKHIVLIAAEQEYRSEQSLPMLAQVLAEHHGFHCTVLFSVNDNGEVDPTLPAPFGKEEPDRRHRIPGLEHLASADCLILMSRFMQLPDNQLKHFHDYLDSGKPLLALRTANHGFYGDFGYRKDDQKVSLRDLLGGAFLGHHGGWHREATRGVIVPEQTAHPIVKGVGDIWGTSDVYRCHNEQSPFPADCQAIVMGQPLVSLERDAEPNTNKEALPIAWTKTWTGNRGLATKIFHFTMGSGNDFTNEGVRRLTVNAVYWGLGIEAEIDPNRSVEIVGEYAPLKSGFNYEKFGVKPQPPSFYRPTPKQPAAEQPAAEQSTENRSTLPNVIIVYADDLGYGDLSCYNDKCAYQTPRIDQLAREGIRFTDAHSPSTICSPSRYGLFSGQQIYRSTGRGGGAFEGPGGPSYLKPETLTIAQMLQAKGYRTGVFGKWHVGLTWLDKEGKRLGGGFDNSLLIDYEKSTPLVDGPNARGFDESFVTPNCPNTDPLYIYIENGMVPVPADHRHQRNSLPNPGGKWRWDNDEGWVAPGYQFIDADLLFFEKTRDFITKHLNTTPDEPFFAVLSTQIAHAPVLPAEEFAGKTSAGPRGDFVYQLDAIVGRVLDLTKELKIDDNTIILFNSDNGAETVHVNWMRQDHDHDASGGWRGMKRDGWEGGHRVPFIARWPAHIPADQISDQLTNTTDIFATLASVVGYQLREQDATDSFDMLPVMLGRQAPEDSIRPHLLTQSFRGEFQIRQGDWKYLDHVGSGGNGYDKGALAKYALPELAPAATGQLYNLAADPGETTNLFFDNESKRIEMKALLERLKSEGRSAPRSRKPIGIEGIKSGRSEAS